MGYRWDQPAYSLSYANRRRLEIARAMATEPRVLLLDEPAAGMSHDGRERLAALLLRLRASGLAIVLVEHDLKLVRSIADTVTVLDAGAVLARGLPRDVAADPLVVRAYLGIEPGGRSGDLSRTRRRTHNLPRTPRRRAAPAG
jgi:ABC-type branched-subunit amino acid transport system ATPase component